MGLPKVDLPKYKHYLVGVEKTVTFRPFTSKEQKILLLAKESEDKKEILEAMVQVVDMCLCGDDVDVYKLPAFDFEDLYLRIRSKSVSNECDIHYRYKETGELLSKTINLDEVKVQTNSDHKNIIMMTDTIGVKLKYPTILDYSLSDDDLVLECIVEVFDEEEVHQFDEYTKEEQLEWLESFDLESASNLSMFFATMPVLKHKTKLKTQDGKELPITLSGLEDFFI